jgi:predicted Rossmann-fold nucleotide-binding protein
MNIVLVCGGRYFNDRKLAYRAIEHALSENKKITQDNTFIMSGGQRGADTLALDWAIVNEWNSARIPAKWTRHGKVGGNIRNREMRQLALLLGGQDQIVFIALPGGVGTAHMVRICLEINAVMRMSRFQFYDYRSGELLVPQSDAL